MMDGMLFSSKKELMIHAIPGWIWKYYAKTILLNPIYMQCPEYAKL